MKYLILLLSVFLLISCAHQNVVVTKPEIVQQKLTEYETSTRGDVLTLVKADFTKKIPIGLIVEDTFYVFYSMKLDRIFATYLVLVPNPEEEGQTLFATLMVTAEPSTGTKNEKWELIATHVLSVKSLPGSYDFYKSKLEKSKDKK